MRLIVTPTKSVIRLGLGGHCESGTEGEVSSGSGPFVSYMANFAGYANYIARIIATFGTMITEL